MKALLLILGLAFSITTFAADPPATDTSGKMGQNLEGCGSDLKGCTCIKSDLAPKDSQGAIDPKTGKPAVSKDK